MLQKEEAGVKKNLMRGSAYLCASLIFLGNTAGGVLETNRNVVDSFLGTKSYTVETGSSEGELYSTFTADYTSTDELVSAHQEMGKRLSEEGSVLLKNEGVLPLKEQQRKVTLLGLRSNAKTLYGATVGVNVPAEQNVSLTTALTEKGLSVNPVMNEVYATLASEDAFNKNVNKVSASFSGVLPGQEAAFVGAEPTAGDFARINSGYQSSFAQYGDAAIVVVGRPGTEAGDYYPGSTGIAPDAARNALALTKDELALIELAKDNFETVIVLVNSANAMELGTLQNDTGVDAILWIGFPGNYGMRGVAGILTGEVNPSGALPDIYASDSASSPAVANYGVMAWSNAGQYLDTAVDRGDYYLMEAEGIYTGYRYYETRYADVVMGQGNADSEVGTFDSEGAWNYAQEVTYPFGYGLSYSTFQQTLEGLSVSVEDETVSATIKVTNTGSVAGKTPVQLYAQAPYTAGGVEKSAVQLLDYSKTELLQPGQSTTVEITADLENLASYDEKQETYLLDQGTYYFTVSNGTHEAVNNILAEHGYSVEDGMDAAGNAENVQTWTLEQTDTKTFGTGADGNEICNRLQIADYNSWNSGAITYLSRSDWAGTWPKTYTGLELTEEMLPYLKNDFYEIATQDDVSQITFGADNGLSFSSMKGLAYDDELWEALLDQLDLQEAINFITKGNRNYPSMESVGFVGGQYTENGPNGFNMALSAYSDAASPWYVPETDDNAAYKCSDIGCAPLMAAAFSKELSYEYGVLWGNDSLYNGLPILWGPGLNLHRTPYNGRNVEYYSEDPVLAGNTGTALIQGGLSKGLIMASKHFAFNDQEANRNGVAPFMQEQKARELELRSFQIAVKGGALGLMTSFSRIGPVYVGASTDLLTGILYGEWGFHGYVVSDMVNPATYMTWKESVMAGTTNFDATEMDESWASYITEDTNALTGDAAMLTAIRNNVHNSMYAFAQSNLMNKVNSSSRKVELNVWWRTAYKGVTYGAEVLTVLFVVGYLFCAQKSRKKKESEKV